MMPPHCKLCRRNSRLNPDEDFKLLRFAYTVEEAKQKSEEDEARKAGRYKVGHPIAAHWFCSMHAEQLRPYKHLTWPQAREALKQNRMLHRSYQFTHAMCREPARSVVHGLRLEDLGNPDFKRLQRQHDIYVQALQEAGVEVNIMPAQEDYPDSLFVEDAALILEGTAILLNPGAKSRAGEPKRLEEDGSPFFKTILQPEFSGPIDGGDILVFDHLVIVGISERTSEVAADELTVIARDFGFGLRKVQTPKNILHFKSHCSLLDEKTALSTRDLAESGCFDGFEVVIVPDDEPQGSNVIRVNDKVIMAEEAPKTISMLQAQGFDVLPVPTSEVAKIDGAVSCCSLRYSL